METAQAADIIVSVNKKTLNQLGDIFMKHNLLLGVLFIFSIVLNACGAGGGGVDAKEEAQAMISKLFSPKQYATSFTSAKKSSSGVITIKDFSLTPVSLGKKLAFKELVISKFDNANKYPLFLKLNLKGFVLNADMLPSPQMANNLKQVYPDDIVMNMDIEQNYVPKSKNLQFNFDVSFQKLAELNIALDLNNVDEAVLDPEKASNPTVVNQIFAAAQVKSAAITLRNIGFMQKISELYSPNAFVAAKAQLIAMENKSKNEHQKNIIKAVTSFIDNQGSIRFGVNPIEPVAVVTIAMLMQNPATQVDLFNKLNFTVVSQ